MPKWRVMLINSLTIQDRRLPDAFLELPLAATR